MTRPEPAGPDLDVLGADGALPSAGAAVVLAELRDLSRGRIVALLGALTVLAAAAAAGLLFPVLVGRLVDGVVRHEGRVLPPDFWPQVAALAGAVLAEAVLGACGVVALSRLVETMIARLRERYVRRALALPAAVLDRVRSGDLVARSSADIAELSETVCAVLPHVTTAVFTLVLSVGGLALVDGRLALVVVALLPFYVATARWYLRTAPAVYAARAAAESTRSSHVLATVQALPTVAAFGLGPTRAALAGDAAWRVARWAMLARISTNRLGGRVYLIETGGLVAMVLVGAALAAAGDLGVGGMSTAVLVYLRVVGPLGALLLVVDDLQGGLVALSRIVGVTRALPPDVATASESASASAPAAATASAPAGHGEAGADPEASGSGEAVDGRCNDAAPAADPPSRGATPWAVRLTGVGLRYRPGHDVLHDVHLTVRPGEHVAVVGATGSGKTSLARVVAGTYAPTSGRLDRVMATRRVVHLGQDAHVFAASLSENVALGRPDASAREVRAALEAAGLGDLPETLPDGLDTLLGRHGHPLTPTQRGHLALARLAIDPPELVILDEATADADSRTAGALDGAAARIIEGRTALVIAHRLDQAVRCDRVVVMASGRIVEAGPHADLVAAGGRYGELWAAWSSSASPGRLADAPTGPPPAMRPTSR